MTLLLTAFEPFGGVERNVSLSTLQALPDRVGEAVIQKVVFPVSFKRAPKELRRQMADVDPDVVIMLGQASSSDKIRLERFAHNLMDSQKPDNDGYQPDEVAISERAKTAYRCSLPLKQIWRECKQKEWPVVISNTAGLFVCNRVYFEALRLRARALFVHIPRDFSVQTAADILKTIIKAI